MLLKLILIEGQHQNVVIKIGVSLGELHYLRRTNKVSG